MHCSLESRVTTKRHNLKFYNKAGFMFHLALCLSMIVLEENRHVEFTRAEVDAYRPEVGH
jgi:hypothetical protein